MRYVLFNWVHPDDVAAWEALSADEQQAEIERHRQWFRKWRDSVVGGEELNSPLAVKTLRRGRKGEGIIVTDGPYIETKEVLGGFVVLEVDSIDEAVKIAREWPSLASQQHATVHVQPVLRS